MNADIYMKQISIAFNILFPFRPIHIYRVFINSIRVYRTLLEEHKSLQNVLNRALEIGFLAKYISK